MSDHNRRLAHEFARMLNEQVVDLLDELLVPDYVNHNPFVEDGLLANKQFWTAWLTAFPDTRVTVEDVIAAGDRVVGRFTYRATHTGSFLGIPATGRPIAMRSIDIWRVQDGKFAEHWDELGGIEFLTAAANPAGDEE